MAFRRCCFLLQDMSVVMHTNLEQDSQVYMLVYSLMNRLYGCLPCDFKDVVIEPDDPDAHEGFSVTFIADKSMENFKDA